MLGVLTAEQLRHALFPIGDTPKPQIREEAARRGLAVADKPDSHDICFIPSGDTRAFLGARIGVRRGAVVDAGGTVLAEHDGVHGFTIGQRKGLGIAGPGPRRAAALRDRDRRRHRDGAGRRRGDLDVWALTGERPVFTAGVAPDGPVRMRGAGARARRHGRRRRRTARGASWWRAAGPAARRGAGPDDGALPPGRRTATRCIGQRDHRTRRVGPSRGSCPTMFVITMSGTDCGNRQNVTSTSTTDFTR